MRGLVATIRSFLFENTSNKQTILKNTFWLGAGEVISKAIAFVLTFVLVSYFSLQQYGEYTFIMGIIALIGVFFEFGFNTEIMRTGKDNEKLKSLFGGKLLLSIPLLIITNLLAYFYVGKELFVPFFLGTIYICLLYFFEFYKSIWKSINKAHHDTFLKVLYSILLLASISVFIFLLHSDHIIYIFICYIFSLVVCLLVAHTFLIRYEGVHLRPKFSVAIVRDVYKHQKGLLLTGVLSSIYFRIDILILEGLTSLYDVGIYGGLYNFVRGINLLPSIVLPALFPFIVEKRRKKEVGTIRAFFGRSLVFFLCAGLCAIGVTHFFGADLLHMVYNKDAFLEADVLHTFTVLIIAGAMMLLTRPVIDIFNATHQEKINNTALIITSIVNIVCNLLLIPRIGYMGAAYATLCSEIVLGIILGYYVVKFLYTRSYDNNISSAS